MILNKALLLKCLGGVAACVGVAGAGIFGSQQSRGNNQSPNGSPAAETNDQTATDLSTLIAKVGLSGCTSTDSPNNECTIGTTGLNVQQGDKKDENKTKDTATSTGSPSGKIKVYSVDQTEGYENKFKFVIEDGDISFGSGTITKLEQFETYEIKEESGKWYFSRKKTASEGIKETLGLPSDCTLGDTVDCTDKEISSTNISSLKFDGLNSGQNPSIQGTATLTVTKETTPSDDFPFGYKFSFKGKSGEVTLTINGSTITLKQNEGTEFKIKKPTTGNNITLEEAWSLNRLLEKVGLQCNESNECTQKSDAPNKTNIQLGTEKLENKTLSNSGSGKIKLYTGNQTSDYNKGFKFVIEGGDITITDGDSKKLEQFETYEIKKDSDKWYFSRKDKAADGIKAALGLPSDCSLPDSGTSTCSIDSNKIGTIKFDGLNSGQNPSITETATLTITKLTPTDSEFPYGYKFGFKAPSSSGSTSTLTIGNKQITLKAAEDTEFKIKKGTSGNSLTLAEVWTLETLAKKVNLTCTDNTCTQISNQTTNIKKDSELDGKTLTTSGSGTGGKIKAYTTDTDGYNKGFRFVIEGGDVSTDDSNTKLEEFETYEIKEESSKWYFSRKDKAEKGIKKALGLPDSDCDFPTDANNTTTCCNLDVDKLKKIKFEDKGENGEVTVANGDTSPSLKISITSGQEKTQFPLGYKFTLISDKDITLNTESSKSIKANTNTEFKIKATSSASGSARTLSLEKAWNAKSLGEKVGLSCQEPTDNGNKECTFTNDNKINVKNDGSSKIEGAKVKDGEGSSKKLKYEEGAAGYNQGIKFTVDGGECIELTKDGDDSATLKIENSTTTYEIKEDGGTWYLTKKETSNGISG